MPRGKPVGDFSGVLNLIVGGLARFAKSGSIFLTADFPSPFELRSTSELKIELPAQAVYTDIRSNWKARDYDHLPRKGICVIDDENGNANSFVTVKFVCKPLGKNDPLPYPSLLKEAICFDANGQPYGYVSEYSYSFYPDLRSKRARDIGYIRFDFHPHVMGDGDIGGHPYFHFHAGLSGEEFEEIELQAMIENAQPKTLADSLALINAKQVSESSVRLPTGFMLPDGFITMLEYKLAPKMRSQRIEKAIADLNWYYLMLDLTPFALKERMLQKYGKKDWTKLVQSEQCKMSMRKAGWHQELFD